MTKQYLLVTLSANVDVINEGPFASAIECYEEARRIYGIIDHDTEGVFRMDITSDGEQPRG